MRGNQSWVTEFILVGFQLSADVEFLLFWVFFMFYVFSLLANGVIFGLICLDPRLHTPMYFFLSHLAVLDIAYASNHVPKMLANLVNQEKTISFVSCVIQVFLYLALAATECFILLVMSYDRYVAICHPLHYTVIMSWRVCTAMASVSWACGFTLAIVHATLLQRLPFCGPRVVNHLYCEILSVLKLACADTSVNQVVVLIASVLVLVGPLFLMLISYTHILFAILRIKSREGRRKAFSTCSSHLCVVGLFFGIGMIFYLVPGGNQREEQQKVLSLFYGLFNPLLNPFIYSLRNAQVKDAFYRVLQRKGVV
ncbi:PREDICTED: olfactory receptor 2A2-like [Elephantulus edwardii]|uniref:olfactory receptor 2A2-like n=1 Tax=Elephantulus edwardii TaxID=28737 RepID=UPI0003F089BE|nr:PREDICTED: olfactory receptor 2A2-like [Elephantulus edwardii]